MHRGIFEERGPGFDSVWKTEHCSEVNLVLSEILTGHIMVSVFLQESQTEFAKHVPPGPPCWCFWSSQLTLPSTPQAHHC